MSMFLYSLTIVWYARDGHKDFELPERPWYPKKEEPSFADMLTTLRRKSWDDKLPKVSLISAPDDNSIDLLKYLATLAG